MNFFGKNVDILITILYILHVWSNILPILRRSNCINTASGIVTLKTSEFSINTIWPPEDGQDIIRNIDM